MSATAVPSVLQGTKGKTASRTRFYPSFPPPRLIPFPFPAEKHLVLLRDGRTLIGFLRSIDQFGTSGDGFGGGERRVRHRSGALTEPTWPCAVCGPPIPPCVLPSG